MSSWALESIELTEFVAFVFFAEKFVCGCKVSLCKIAASVTGRGMIFDQWSEKIV